MMGSHDERTSIRGNISRRGYASWLLGCLCMLACALGNADEAPKHAASLADSVGLNHVYVVLDEETFAAIRGSEMLRSELAAVDTGLPAFDAPRPDSQRLYIRGRTTYVELLGPRNPFNEPVGKIGLALGVDEPALLHEVQAAWSASFGSAADRYEVEWKKATPPVPWYDVIQHRITSNNPYLVLWVSAYRPEFLPWLYPQRSALDNRGSRADFLAPLFRPERLFQDVTGLTVAIPEPLRRQVARQLEALGYRPSVRGELLELQSTGWTLTLVEPSTRRQGLLSMTIATNRNRAADIDLGPRSVIEFNIHSALWHFK